MIKKKVLIHEVEKNKFDGTDEKDKIVAKGRRTKKGKKEKVLSMISLLRATIIFISLTEGKIVIRQLRVLGELPEFKHTHSERILHSRSIAS